LDAQTQEALRDAIALAKDSHHAEVGPDHLLSAALSQDGGVAIPLLDRLGIAPLSVRNKIAESLARVPKAYGTSEPSLSRELSEAFERADKARTDMGDEYLSVEHSCWPSPTASGSTTTTSSGRCRPSGAATASRRRTRGAVQSLEKYGRDLTELARQGKLDPVIGRDDEIRRVIQVLSRRTKNNPVLIASPGWKDRHRRGARHAHRGRRRARVAQEQAAHRPRSRLDGRRREVPGEFEERLKRC